MRTPSFRKENKLMGPEKQNSIASEETKNTKKLVIDDPGSNRRESSGSSSTTNLADEVFTKIATIFKKQSFGEAFKEGVNAFRKEATRCFRKGNNKGSLSSREDQISIETMSFAIKSLHATENPLNLLKVKEGNKKELLAELERIATNDKHGHISRDTFRAYVEKNERQKTRLRWWTGFCCDDPEEKPKGKLVDYFFAIARARKVAPTPLAMFFFSLFAVLHILIHTEASDAWKDRLNFDV